MENRLLLLYCITDKFDNDLAQVLGLDNKNKLFTVEHKNLFCIVSEVHSDEYGEEIIKNKSEDINWLTENAKRFMEIMTSILERSNLIPMKFLTIFSNEDRIKSTIEKNYDRFMNNFKKIENRKELSLKIYCNDKIFKKNCMSEEIESFEKSLIGKTKGSAFFLRKKFDGELNNKVQDKICKIANLIAENMYEFAEDMKSNKLLAKEITGIDIPMIINCAFLVDINKEENFELRFNELKSRYEKDGFLMELSGPWPPYNFCE